MKHIKTFESILNKEDKYSKDDITDGDYALFYYDKFAEYAYHYRLTPELKAFINDNIGIIHTISDKHNTWIDVIYENIPDTIKYKFSSYNSIMLQKDAIVAFSKNIEDLETKLAAKKYNL